MNKKVFISLALALAVTASAIGVYVYAGKRDQMPENYYGVTKYEEMDKKEIRSYAADHVTIMKGSIALTTVNYNLQKEEDQYDAATDYAESYETLAKYLQSYSSQSVPANMKDVHEKLNESVYNMGLAVSEMTEASETGDFTAVDEYISKADQLSVDAIKSNEHLIWNKDTQTYNYLESKSNK